MRSHLFPTGCVLLLLLVSAATAGLMFSIGPAPIELDAIQYWALAGQVAEGDWLLMGSSVDYRTPLYPVFLGIHRYLFGSQALLAVVVSQHVLLLVTSLVMAVTAWQLSGSRLVGLACYGLASLSLMRPWFANIVCTEPLFLFFMALSFAVLCAYHRSPGWRWAVAFGVLLGLTILVRPVPKLLWIPLVGLFLVHGTGWVGVERRRLREVLGHACAVALVLAIVVSPWLARNWALFGEPFLARLPAVNKWQVCFQGGSAARLDIPDSTAGQRVLELIGTPDGDVVDRYCYGAIGALERQGLTTAEIDELVTQTCLDAVARQPFDFCWPAFKRFVNYWRCTPTGIPYYEFPHHITYAGQATWEIGATADLARWVLRRSPAHSLRWNELMTVGCAVGTCLMMVRRRTRLVGCSLALMFVYFAAVTSAVEVENYKYRVVLEPFMFLAIACGWLGDRDIRRAGASAVPQSESMRDTVPYGVPRMQRAPVVPDQVIHLVFQVDADDSQDDVETSPNHGRKSDRQVTIDA